MVFHKNINITTVIHNQIISQLKILNIIFVGKYDNVSY